MNFCKDCIYCKNKCCYQHDSTDIDYVAGKVRKWYRICSNIRQNNPVCDNYIKKKSLIEKIKNLFK